MSRSWWGPTPPSVTFPFVRIAGQAPARTEEITVKKRIVANALSVVRLAALAAHGFAWIPGGYASADVARGKLVPVLKSFWPPPVPVQLLYPTSRHLAPQVRAAVELLMDRFTV